MYFDIVHTSVGFHAVTVDTRKKRSQQVLAYHGQYDGVDTAMAQNTRALPVRHWVRGEVKKWR